MAVNMFPKFNIEVSFVQAGCSVEEYEKQIKPNTKVHESKKMTSMTIVFFRISSFTYFMNRGMILTNSHGKVKLDVDYNRL